MPEGFEADGTLAVTIATTKNKSSPWLNWLKFPSINIIYLSIYFRYSMSENHEILKYIKIEKKAHCEETKQWTNLDSEIIQILKSDRDFKISPINMLDASIWKK